MLPTVDKNRASAAWIAALRQAFPCEPEVDQFLTRKMERRSGPGYTPVTLSSLCDRIEALLRAQLDHAFTITEPRWLTGGASKLQMAFKLAWCPDGKTRVTTPMVLRMQPAESIVESSRRREFQLINALQGRVAVPQVYWLDNEGDYLPYPALIYGLMAGVTKPTRGVGGAVSGMGTNYGPRLRSLLAPQFVRDLALIHTRPWADAEPDAFEIPPPGPLAVTRQLNWWARVWQESRSTSTVSPGFTRSRTRLTVSGEVELPSTRVMKGQRKWASIALRLCSRMVMSIPITRPLPRVLHRLA